MLNFYTQFKFIGFSPLNGYLYSAEVGFHKRSFLGTKESINFEQFRKKDIIFEILNTDALNLLIESNFGNGDLCVFFNNSYIGEYLDAFEIEDCLSSKLHCKNYNNSIDFFLANKIYPNFNALDIVKVKEDFKVVPIFVDLTFGVSSSILGESTDVFSGSFNDLKNNYPNLFTNYLNGKNVDFRTLWNNEEFSKVYSTEYRFTTNDNLLGRSCLPNVTPLSSPGGNELQLNQTDLEFSLLMYNAFGTIQIPGFISLSSTNFYLYSDYENWEIMRENNPFFGNTKIVVLNQSYARYFNTCLISNTKGEYILSQEQFNNLETRLYFNSFIDYLREREGREKDAEAFYRQAYIDFYEGN